MMREYQVRICERLGVQFPGPTRHEERFPPTSLNGRYRLDKATFAGMRRNGRDAPIPDVQSEVRFDPNPFAAAA